MKTFLKDINDGWKMQIVMVVGRGGGDNSLKTDATEKTCGAATNRQRQIQANWNEPLYKQAIRNLTPLKLNTIN